MMARSRQIEPVGHVRRGSVMTQFTLTLCLTALLSCAAVGAVVFFVRAQSIRSERSRELEILRDLQVDALRAWLRERRTDLEIWAHSDEMRDLCKAARRGEAAPSGGLLGNLRHGPASRSVCLVNAESGLVMLEATSHGESHPKLPGRMRTAALESEGVVFSDIVPCKEHGDPVIVSAAAVTLATGEVVGILASYNSSTEIVDILRRVGALGETGEALLVNHSGLAMTPLRYRLTKPGRFRITAEPAARGAGGQTGTIVVEDYRSVVVVAAYGHIPDTGWGIVVKQDASEVEAPVRSLLRDIIQIAAVVLALSVAIGLLFAWRIVRPARRIADAATAITEGDSSVRAPEIGPRELANIAIALNVLVEALAERSRVQTALTDLYRRAGENLVLDDLLIDVLNRLCHHTRSQVGVAYLTMGDETELCLTTAVGIPVKKLPERISLSPPEHMLARVVRDGEAEVLTGFPDSGGVHIPTTAGQAPPCTLAAVPLIVGSRPIGSLGLASLEHFRPEDEKLLAALGTGFSQAVLACQSRSTAIEVSEELSVRNEQLSSLNRELEAQAGELRLLADELDLQRKEVEEASEQRTRFFSNVSHELRTPLNSILALSQLMLERGTGTAVAEEREFLEVIERNGRELLDLINNLLDLAKFEAGQIEVHPLQFDILNTLEDVRGTLRPIAEERGLDLDVVSPVDPPIFFTDRGKLRQVLLNLLSNAIRFTREGRVALVVQLEDGSASFAVSDTGPGISEEEIPLIFEEFRHAGGAGIETPHGTGLGLAISRMLAEQLGGSLEVESELGVGSTFTLRVPPVLPNLGRDAGDRNETLPMPGREPTVLVVDDDEIARMQIAVAVEEAGAKSASAADGSEAIRVLAELRPAAILLDLMMPGMDGFELLDAIRSSEHTAGIPILVLTAKELDPEQLARLERNGIRQLIQKGKIDREELVRQIRSLVGLADATGRSAEQQGGGDE